MKPKAIAVVGPTATGKTALGIHIAGCLQTEVVSADSQLVYRELNIGTAKPTEAEKKGIPHRMIDVARPNEAFSAAAYEAMATEHMRRLWHEGRIPVVVGGTGFYIRALLEAEFIPDVPPDEAFRNAMAERAEAEGTEVLHRLLAEQDPRRAADLHPNDRVRIIRALEIIEATGKPVPQRNQGKELDVIWYGLTYEDRDRLRQLIDGRIEAMLQAGWMEEVEGLVECYGTDAQALKVAHGYPELVEVVLGRRTLEDAVAQIRINIHQYARRQMTWFRRNRQIQWFRRDETDWDGILETIHNGVIAFANEAM